MSENQETKQVTPEPVSNIVEIPVATGVGTINFEELKSNSVVIIKIAPEGMQQRIAATQQITAALRPFKDKIKEKNIAFIVMGTGETMETLDEEQMNTIGWVKKTESRIIIPR